MDKNAITQKKLYFLHFNSMELKKKCQILLIVLISSQEIHI